MRKRERERGGEGMERDGRSENWTDERIHIGCFYDDIMRCLVTRLYRTSSRIPFFANFYFFLA